MTRVALALVLAALLAAPGAASAQQPPEPPALSGERHPGVGPASARTREALAAQLVGRWVAEAQGGADEQTLDVLRADLPEYGSHVFYFEQRAGADGRRVTRQGLWVLTLSAGEPGAVLQVLYQLDEPARYVGAWAEPGVLSGARLAPPGPEAACPVVWRPAGTGFQAEYAEGGLCRIVDRPNGRLLKLDRQWRLGPTTFRLDDQLYDGAGRVLDEALVTFRRLATR